MRIEIRTDCEFFEPKSYAHSCGDCQTDGHYLCIGCKHIADFDEMELSDNRRRYYPILQKQREQDDKFAEFLAIEEIVNPNLLPNKLSL